MIKAQLVLCGFEAVFDRPSADFNPHLSLHGGVLRMPGGEERQIAIGDPAADQQASCPDPAEGGADILGVKVGQFEIGSVMEALSLCP